MMVQPRCKAALRLSVATLIVFDLPQGHLYVAVSVSSATSLMTLVTILVADSKFDHISLSFVSCITSEGMLPSCNQYRIAT